VALRSGSVHTGLSWFDLKIGGELPSRLPSRFRNGPRPASRLTQSRHCDVAVVCTLPLSDVGLRQPAESVYLSVRRHFRWPGRSTSPKRRCDVARLGCSTILPLGSPHGFVARVSVSAHLTQPKPCGVTVVCTLPLPALGSRQTAGALASRSAGDNARQSGQPKLATGSILTGQSWFDYCGGGSRHCLPSRSRFRPRPISVFPQPRHCDVTVVCTLPLSGFGL